MIAKSRRLRSCYITFSLLISSAVVASMNVANALRGKSYLVTGSTDGIGQHTAKLLHQQGATVVLHGRDAERLKKSKDRLLENYPDNPHIHCYRHDLSTISGTAALAKDIIANHKQLDGLVNNAGIFTEEFVLTDDDMESTFAINVAAPYVLSCMLLPLLRKTKRSRILNVSSISQGGKMDINNLQFQNGGFSSHASYSLSKLCIAAMSHELALRLPLSGDDGTLVFSCDPGTVNTKMLLAGWGYCGIDINSANDQFKLIAESELSFEEAVKRNLHGQYFVHGRPSQCSRDKYNDTLRLALWNELEKLTGYTLP